LATQYAAATTTPAEGLACAPLLLSATVESDGNTRSLHLTYELNSTALRTFRAQGCCRCRLLLVHDHGCARVAFHLVRAVKGRLCDVSLLLTIDGGLTKLESKPTGALNKNSDKVLWKVWAPPAPAAD